MIKMTISIVIPNYNGVELLGKNLQRVIEVAGELCQEIIIVDDASTDDSVAMIKRLFASELKKSRLKIIRNKTNQGFSSSANLGVKAAKGKIVVLLNSDVYPEKGFLNAVLPHFKDDKVLGVGFMDKSIESSKVVLRGRGIGWWERGFYVHSRGEVDKTDTAWIAGGSAAFRKKIFLQLGGFSPIYNPFYWEDIDLSYRAVKAGYRILFEPRAVVIHEHEKGAIRQKFTTQQRQLVAYRNQFLFVWRNANLFQLINNLFWLPYHLIFTTIKSRGLFLLGFILALSKIPEFFPKIRPKKGK